MDLNKEVSGFNIVTLLFQADCTKRWNLNTCLSHQVFSIYVFNLIDILILVKATLLR